MIWEYDMTISRRNILKKAVLAITAVSLSNPFSSVFAAKTHKVIIKDFSFNPKNIHIRLGDTIEWKNIDGFLHSATSDSDNIFDTETIYTGDTTSVTFSSSEHIGEIPYHCEIYPSIKGSIIVDD